MGGAVRGSPWRAGAVSEGDGRPGEVYVDTNVYVYVALRHPELGEPCARVLRAVVSGELRAAGSDLVAIELLGSLARVGPEVAEGALEAYLAMPVRRLEVDERVLRAAALINGVVNVGYDAVHAALMLLNGVGAVVTNDLGDWVRLAKRLTDVASTIEEGEIQVRSRELAVISPRSFPRPVEVGSA